MGFLPIDPSDPDGPPANPKLHVLSPRLAGVNDAPIGDLIDDWEDPGCLPVWRDRRNGHALASPPGRELIRGEHAGTPKLRLRRATAQRRENRCS
jgi:hypothetical protein